MGPRSRAGSVVVILLGSCLITSAASATPAPDKNAQAQHLAEQLDAQGRQISMLDEQFNQARLKAQQLGQQVVAINAQVALSDQKLAAARQRLGQASVDSYIHSGSAPLLGALIHANGADLGVRRTYVHVALNDQRHALSGFESARRDLLALRDQLQGAQRSARATANSIDANRRAALAAIAAQQQTTSKVQADLAPLVAAATVEQAQVEQKKVEARVATGLLPAAGSVPAAAAVVAHTATTAGHTSSPPTTAAPKPVAPTGPPPPVSGGASTAVSTAKAQLGKPYEYGAAGPDSFDCSGLTMYAWRAGGVSLPHSAAMQYDAIPHVAVTQLQPGDLVFFGSPIYHEGIYVGGGQMLEAPHTGAVVRYASIYRSDLVGVGRP